MIRIRALANDSLGEKGESRFREICADAGLICNSAGHDRAGWDFIVEFGFEMPNGSNTLDKRKRQYSCHIQVKSMWVDNDRFEMRLSSAEFLAKEPKPTFVYVLKANEKLEFIEAYLIHLLDDNLATILKRLRREQAQGAAAINRKKITFRPSVNERRIDVTGKALREAIIAECGPDLQSYIVKKDMQLKELGFGASRYETNFTFQVQSYEELVDGFLGLKKIEVRNFDAFEKRFGIKLPIEKLTGSGQIHIQPNPADACTIMIRGEGSNEPAVFEGEIYFPALPGLIKEHFKILVHSKFLDITIKRDSFHFQTNAIDEMESLKIEDWLNCFRMLHVISKAAGSINIRPKELPLREITLPLRAATADAERADNYQRTIVVLERAAALLRLAGASDISFKSEEIGQAAKDILAVGRLMENDPRLSPLSFNTENHEALNVPASLEVLYVNFISLGKLTLGYFSVATMDVERHPTEISWRSKKIDAREIRVLQYFPDDYDEFIEHAKRATGIDAVIANRPVIEIATAAESASPSGPIPPKS